MNHTFGFTINFHQRWEDPNIWFWNWHETFYIFRNWKTKISSVTIEQFSKANSKIFLELLFSIRLLIISIARDYHSYSIKIYELLRKTLWNLACDMMTSTEYCSISMVTHGVLTRAIYTNSHLYLTGQKKYLQRHNICQSIVSGSVSSQHYATQTSNHEVCRNYNRVKAGLSCDVNLPTIVTRKLAPKPVNNLTQFILTSD